NAALANLEVPGLVQLYSTLLATSLEVETGPAKEYFTARFERVRGDLECRLREDQAAGIVRADVDPARMAALIVAASDGLLFEWLLEPSIELQEMLDTCAVLLAPGETAWPGPLEVSDRPPARVLPADHRRRAAAGDPAGDLDPGPAALL